MGAPFPKISREVGPPCLPQKRQWRHISGQITCMEAAMSRAESSTRHPSNTWFPESSPVTPKRLLTTPPASSPNARVRLFHRRRSAPPIRGRRLRAVRDNLASCCACRPSGCQRLSGKTRIVICSIVLMPASFGMRFLIHLSIGQGLPGRKHLVSVSSYTPGQRKAPRDEWPPN